MSSAPSPAPVEIPGGPGRPWVTWLLTGSLLLGLAGWWLWTPFKTGVRNFMAEHHAEKAEASLAKKEWTEAQHAILKAEYWKRDNPRVLRVITDYLITTKGPPASTLHYLRTLEDENALTEDDRIQMARLHVQLQDAASAKDALSKLSPEALETRPALEVDAEIHRLRGDALLADRTLRRALKLDPNDRMCRLRLAQLDLKEPFDEIKEQARKTLWELAAGEDDAALQAIEHLARDTPLLPSEAQRLLDHISRHPAQTDAVRLAVLSGFIRTSPEKKEQLVLGEIERMRELKVEALAPSLFWLLQQGMPQHLVGMHPRDYFTRSAEIIEPYLQALAQLGRWQEIEQMLSRPAGMPVSEAYIAYWRARATWKLDEETTRARQHLLTAWEATGRGRNAGLANACAALAEQAGIWDAAAKFYKDLAENQPGSRISMLEKLHEMARYSRDVDALLESAATLLELRPENQRYLHEFLYVHLVTGQAIETIQNRLDALPLTSGRGMDEERLCRALSAYRMGNLDEMRQHLESITDPQSLGVGQRAVHAGLLNLSGQVGEAYAIAERVPSALLLKEERRFLDRAL